MSGVGSVAELAAVLAGTAILLVAFAIAQVATRAETSARLQTFVRRNSLQPQASIKRQSAEPQPAVVERMNRRIQRARFGRKLQLDLVRAGVDMPVSRFVLLRVIGVAAGYLVASVLANRALGGGIEAVGAAALGALLAWFIPRQVLRIKEGRRLKKFEGQLANTIDAMAGALQAGSSLPQAMEMVSREMPAPMGEELAIVVREIAVGVPMQEAFANMLERVRSLDLDMLLTSITIQHRVGGNLSGILRSLSHTVRERQRIRGEIAVLTAQQRMSAYVVASLPVGVVGVLFVIAPSYIIKLFQPGITRAMLVIGLVGIALGYYAMRKIADIDV